MTSSCRCQSWLFRKPFERPFPLSKGPSDLSPFRKVYHIWPKKCRLCQSLNQSNLINLMDDKSDPWRKLRSTEVPCSMPDACGLHPDHSCTSCQTWIRETFDDSSSGSTPPSVQQWVQTTPPQNPDEVPKKPDISIFTASYLLEPEFIYAKASKK